MPVALCATSHSPLMGLNDPAQDVVDEVNDVLRDAREFVSAFAPDLVVLFAPDHYNGFLYDMMPPYCIGAEATSVGDYGLPAGPLNVDSELARQVAQAVLDDGVDIALSEAMQVDHGFVQPLSFLFGGLDTPPIIPVFVNCVASPLVPAKRCSDLGAAIGRALAAASQSDKHILFVGSGGLSHDPPVPRFEAATPEVIERLKHGRNPSTEQRAERESRTVAAAAAFASGDAPLQELNPEWDAFVLDSLASGDLERVDRNSIAWFVENGGHSSHEIRTWLAAYAALRSYGPYRMESRYYRPIKEWIAGFATTTAASLDAIGGGSR